jgi:hypothetical protein
MGINTWMVVFADTDARNALAAQPVLDRPATMLLAGNLFPGESLEPIGEGDLSSTCPPRGELYIGVFPGVAVAASRDFALDHPSLLPAGILAAGGSGVVTLHAMHSVVDWFAYAIWRNGTLLRSLSLSPDDGVMEDIGARLAFEAPYWSGQHPAVGILEKAVAYPLPFHPLELGAEALRDQFGYQLEGLIDPGLLDPASIPLVRYRRSRPSRWKFWR